MWRYCRRNMILYNPIEVINKIKQDFPGEFMVYGIHLSLFQCSLFLTGILYQFSDLFFGADKLEERLRLVYPASTMTELLTTYYHYPDKQITFIPRNEYQLSVLYSYLAENQMRSPSTWKIEMTRILNRTTWSVIDKAKSIISEFTGA